MNSIPSKVRGVSFANSVVTIAATDTGAGVVSTQNREGYKMVELNSFSSDPGNGTIFTYDGNGQRLVGISATTDGEGVIATYNRAGQVKNYWP